MRGLILIVPMFGGGLSLATRGFLVPPDYEYPQENILRRRIIYAGPPRRIKFKYKRRPEISVEVVIDGMIFSDSVFLKDSFATVDNIHVEQRMSW